MRNDNDRFDETGNDAPNAGWGAQDLRTLSDEAFANAGVGNIVYVREVLAGDLMDEFGSEIKVPADTQLYSVHAANGERMAVLDDRNAAFAGARQYDLEPVSVH